MAGSMKISRKEPVHFRVRAAGPHPIPEYPGQLHVDIEYLDHPSAPRILPISPNEFAPYSEAIRDAIASQAVYEVSWDYPEMPVFPPRDKDTTIDRLLNAIRDSKVVD